MATAATLVAGLVAGAATAHGAEVERGVDWATVVRQRPAERINVLTVEPGRVGGVLSNDRIAGRERVSSMAERVGAVAGVNGGFFAPSGGPGGGLALDGAVPSQ